MSPDLRDWEQTQQDSEDEGLDWPGRLGCEGKQRLGRGKTGTVRTALCRGLSLRPQSFFLIGRKLKVIIAKSSSLSLKTTSKSVTFLFWYKAFHFPFFMENQGKKHTAI